MGPPQISEELPGQTKPQSESSFSKKFVSVIVFASVSVFSSVFAGVVEYVFESVVVSAFDCVSIFVSVFVFVSAFPFDAAVADLFLIEDPVDVAVAVKALTIVQKQSLIREILSETAETRKLTLLGFPRMEILQSRKLGGIL